MSSAVRMVKAIINVQPIIRGDVTSLKQDRHQNRNHLKKWFDDVIEFEKRTFLLTLVSVHVNEDGKKKTTKAQQSAKYIKLNDEPPMFKYECNFKVPNDFGEIGAILIQNVSHKETYIKNIVLDDAPKPKVTYTCESWIHTTLDNNSERIFFSNESYLPSNTPQGLRSSRRRDLESLRGNGEGERKSFERIYDYDMYNDLGDRDTSAGTDQPVLVLGGNEHPYPRRCRTGRPMDQGLESRTTLPFYVPRDEEFSDTKAVTYGMNRLYDLAAGNLVKLDMNQGLSSLSDIDLLYDKCVEIIDPGNGGPSVLRRLLKDLVIIKKSALELEKKRKNDKKSFNWLRDEEFCRQTLAGVNPYSIQLVQEWPLKSILDSKVYGSAKSAFTKEIVEQEIKKHDTAMDLKKALDGKQLFLLDYHDMFLPYVNKVSETLCYCSRTLMLLTEGILKPLAIELTRPKTNERDQWKRVYVPTNATDADATDATDAGATDAAADAADADATDADAADADATDAADAADADAADADATDATDAADADATDADAADADAADADATDADATDATDADATDADATDATKPLLLSPWNLAKAHVLAHDSCHHQLVSHWLRTHCVMEPYIIATHRQLSKMHPIHRLLSPHFRYTMQTNALARRDLISANGVIENNFALGRYSMQFSSDAYRQWRFDFESLPDDLIRRGMAFKDGRDLKLRIEDYPFANDGLLLWDAIEKWATAYVNRYYQFDGDVLGDKELKEWWNDIKTKGHADKKHETWWPNLIDRQDLIGIVSKIMWVASGHHSAVNFGQYTAGYFPYKPTIVKTKMPNDPTCEEGPENGLSEYLQKNQSTDLVIYLLDILSTHSPDEEYIGVKMEPAWEADPAIKAAFQGFSDTLRQLGSTIDDKNKKDNLKNRIGARGGMVPYELLKPKSDQPGVTGKGVPYSISI